MAAAIAVAGGAAGSAVIFLPSRPRAVASGQAVASRTTADVGHARAYANGLQLSELVKASYAARAAAASRARHSDHKLAAAMARRTRKPSAAAPLYLNPLRAIAGLQPQRIDMGADFAGTGPIYPIGDAIITGATGSSAGWPGGGWITYQLTDGPAAGIVVYVAEDVTPTVSAGMKVTPTTVIANMFNGSAGIETGWAMADGASAESQAPEAGGISGGGPFPTKVGVNFDELLQALGVPAAPNAGQSPFGLLPSNYPVSWPGLG